MNPETLVIEIENILGNAPKKERGRLIEAVEKGLAEHAKNVPPTTTSAPLTDEEISLIRDGLRSSIPNAKKTGTTKKAAKPNETDEPSKADSSLMKTKSKK